MTFVLLCGAAIAFAVGGVFMKYSHGLTRPGPSAALVALFIVGAALQALAMRSTLMSTAYIFVLGLEAVIAFLLAVWLFSEPATATRVIAIGLITVGIAMLRL